VLFCAGETGTAWRLTSGLVRLDHVRDGQTTFANLAITGDILGCETLLFGQYSFHATALAQCLLTPWPGEASTDQHSLLDSLANAQRRAAELIALRGGQAVGRILQLVRLLADPEGQVILPGRQDIADITDLRFETVSRIIHGLIREQTLTPVRVKGVHATRSYSFARKGI
jgi:CRP-like cAMP-binding protein